MATVAAMRPMATVATVRPMATVATVRPMAAVAAVRAMLGWNYSSQIVPKDILIAARLGLLDDGVFRLTKHASRTLGERRQIPRSILLRRHEDESTSLSCFERESVRPIVRISTSRWEIRSESRTHARPRVAGYGDQSRAARVAENGPDRDLRTFFQMRTAAAARV